LKNTSTSSAAVTRSSIGFYKAGWTDANAAIRNFFSSASQSWTVGAGSTIWLTDEYTESSQLPFTGMLRLTSDKTVELTAYAYRTSAGITGDEVVYPRDSGFKKNVYSGRGTGYF
jgi:hypothetical protein